MKRMEGYSIAETLADAVVLLIKKAAALHAVAKSDFIEKNGVTKVKTATQRQLDLVRYQTVIEALYLIDRSKATHQWDAFIKQEEGVTA